MIQNSCKIGAALLLLLAMNACRPNTAPTEPDTNTTQSIADDNLTPEELGWIATQPSRPAHYEQGGNYFNQQVAQLGPPPWEREDQGTGLSRYEFDLRGKNGVVFSNATVWVETDHTGEDVGWCLLAPPENFRPDDLPAVIRSSIVDEYEKDSMYWPPNGPGICHVTRNADPDVLVIDLTPPTGFDNDWIVVIPPEDSEATPEWTFWSDAGRTLQGPVTVTSRAD
jgi:hypothetical protein